MFNCSSTRVVDSRGCFRASQYRGVRHHDTLGFRSLGTRNLGERSWRAAEGDRNLGERSWRAAEGNGNLGEWSWRAAIGTEDLRPLSNSDT